MERAGEIAVSTMFGDPEGTPATRVLYIGGTGRSGSTVIERTLAQLPGVVSVGELRALWRAILTNDRRCTCGADVSACEFWHEVGEQAFGGWQASHVESLLRLQRSVDRHRRLLRLLRSSTGEPGHDARSLADAWGATFGAIARITSAELVVDASKYPAHAAVLRDATGVDLRILHLVRDPRGVAFSWSKRGILKPDATDGHTYMPVFGYGRSAVDWVTYNLAFDRMQTLGTPTLRLRYETFVDDPLTAIRRTSALAGVDLSDADLSFLSGREVALRREPHAIGGNPDRFREHSTSIRLNLDDSWRREMSPVRRAQVALVSWPLMRRYGYAVGTRSEGKP